MFIFAIILLYAGIYQIVNEGQIFFALIYKAIGFECYMHRLSNIRIISILHSWFRLLHSKILRLIIWSFCKLDFLLGIEARHGPTQLLFGLDLLFYKETFKVWLICRKIVGFSKVILDWFTLVENLITLPRDTTKFDTFIAFLILFLDWILLFEADLIHKFNLVLHLDFPKILFL